MSKIDLIPLDIETTGLDFGKDFILEIAFGAAELSGKWLVEPNSFFVEAPANFVIERIRERPVVAEMHQKNGLFADWSFGTRFDIDRIAERFQNVVRRLRSGGYDDIRIAGCSTHFDRRFIEAQQGQRIFFEGVSHRIHDLTPIKTFAKNNGLKPEMLETENVGGVTLTEHRALDDIERDMAQLKMLNRVASFHNFEGTKSDA